MPSPWSACCLRGIAQNSQRIWHHCPGVELRYCYTNTKNQRAKGKCSASKTLFQIICSTYWTFNIKRVILMIICVSRRTNNAKICFTRTTHSKIITTIRVSCLSCPRHESNCQHYRHKISAAAGHWQTNPSRVRLIELSLSSYFLSGIPFLHIFLTEWTNVNGHLA